MKKLTKNQMLFFMKNLSMFEGFESLIQKEINKILRKQVVIINVFIFLFLVLNIYITKDISGIWGALVGNIIINASMLYLYLDNEKELKKIRKTKRGFYLSERIRNILIKEKKLSLFNEKKMFEPFFETLHNKLTIKQNIDFLIFNVDTDKKVNKKLRDSAINYIKKNKSNLNYGDINYLAELDIEEMKSFVKEIQELKIKKLQESISNF